MQDDFVQVTIKDLDKVQAALADLPKEAGDRGMEQATNYLLNVLVNKEVPGYKYVSRAQAYGMQAGGLGWFSDKQRRYVMSQIKKGYIKIPYPRRGLSGGVQSQWKIHSSGQEAELYNYAPGAPYLYGEEQANQPRLVGWKRLEQIIDQYTKQITDSFERGVRTAIQKLHLE